MVALVDLERAKSMLSIDGPYRDDDLLLMINAASENLIWFAKNPEWASADPLVVPERFQLATIALVVVYLREADGDEQRLFGLNELPVFVTALLSGDRAGQQQQPH